MRVAHLGLALGAVQELGGGDAGLRGDDLGRGAAALKGGRV